MKKILITGSNGQLGREITKQYNENKKAELILTDYKELDITDVNAVYGFVNQHRPEVIINCAAHTQVDKCETDVDNAYKINTIGPKIFLRQHMLWERKLFRFQQTMFLTVLAANLSLSFTAPIHRQYTEKQSFSEKMS